MKEISGKLIVLPLVLPIAVVMVIAGLLAASCESDDLRQSRKVQQDVSGTAFAAVPPYQPSSFPAREDINWYLRETETRDTWYVYAINREGIPIFYVVSDMKPRNICIHITSPERVRQGIALSAPALDGVYYGGAGCDAYYLRDAATGNFIELAGQTFTLISSKVPLALETDALRFKEE